MPESQSAVRYDVDGYDVVTAALMELINQYPALRSDNEIAFSTLPEDGGVALFPVSGAVIESESEDITGHVTRYCLYPFVIVYRAADPTESRKISIKEWLDKLGRWLERQKITVDDAEYQISEYPPLTGNREFISIERQTPAFFDSKTDDAVEDWQISISAKYKSEFYR